MRGVRRLRGRWWNVDHRSWRLLIVFAVGAIVSGCGFPRPPDVPGPGDDSTPPGIVATTPQPHAASVDPTTAIQVTFSEPIDVRSGPRFVVTAAGDDVQGTVTADGDTLTFHSTTPLPSGTPLTVTVDGVADVAGNQQAAPYTFDFTTKTTLCVKAGGGDGCFALPSEAVAASGSADSIAVAAGEYLDNILIDKTLNLLGGFDASFSIRDSSSSSNTTTIRPQAPANMNIPIVDITTASVLLDGLTLTEGNTGEHGGAIRISGGTHRIQNNVLSGNTAFFLGGGIYIFGGATVQLNGNTIENNTVGGQDNCSGAGVAVENSTVLLRDNLITSNRVLGDLGAGGGVVLYGAVATFVNNHIDGNHAGGIGQVGNGGGVSSQNSKVTFAGGSISHNDVGNTTGAGGGLYVNMGEVRLDDVHIEGNTAGLQTAAGASGLHSIGAQLILASSIVASNISGTGGISVGPPGAAVIANCTIADNPGRGVATSTYLTVMNSAILREPVGIAVVGNPAPSVLVHTNALFSNTANVSGMTLDASNIVVDPRLDNNLHLTAGSPLIDAAQPGSVQSADPTAPPVEPPTTDIDGDPRVMGPKDTHALPDIGADEFRPINP